MSDVIFDDGAFTIVRTANSIDVVGHADFSREFWNLIDVIVCACETTPAREDYQQTLLEIDITGDGTATYYVCQFHTINNVDTYHVGFLAILTTGPRIQNNAEYVLAPYVPPPPKREVRVRWQGKNQNAPFRRRPSG